MILLTLNLEANFVHITVKDDIWNLDYNIIELHVAQYTKMQIKKGTIAQIIPMRVYLT